MAKVEKMSKMETSLVRHLNKCYKGKTFISNDVVNSFRLTLQGGKTPVNVKAGMLLTNLRKKGVIQQVSEYDNHKRGVNNRVYKIV
jgi:hypothetical protein